MLVIAGKSCSGKDTITEELVKMGYKRLVTYTTRPVRENEIDGITYHFISTEDFLKKYIDGFFLEARYYHTENGVWFYGSSVEAYENADYKTVCILTPSGLHKLRHNLIPFTSFLIDVSDDEIKKRQELRGDNLTPQKKAEAIRRFNADKIDFANIDHLIDFTVNNENKKASEVAKEIDKLYKHY